MGNTGLSDWNHIKIPILLVSSYAKVVPPRPSRSPNLPDARIWNFRLALLRFATLILADIEVVPSCRKAFRVFQMDIRSDSRWERFVSAHPNALIYHHPGWLLALESEYRQRCVTLACEDEIGQIAA